MKRGYQVLPGLGLVALLGALLFPVFAKSRDTARTETVPPAPRTQSLSGNGGSGPAAVTQGSAAQPVDPNGNTVLADQTQVNRMMTAQAKARYQAVTETAKMAARPSLATGAFGNGRGSFATTHGNFEPGVDAAGGKRVAVSSPAAAPPPAYNPNMYLSNTYIGGSGERDRLEKLINAGVMVDGKRVKLEAFSRNYAQSFPIPTQTALNLVADTERTRIIVQGDHTYLQVGLQAIKGESPRRAPLNIALVIDRSGSMGDEHKLEYAKAAAMQLVDKLGDADTFSLVAFDDTVSLLVPAQQVRNKAQVKNQIAALTPGGGTNIYAGLKLGYEQTRKHLAPDGVNRVILLSDGEVTAGISDPQQFYQMASANADDDIQTTSVGLGVEFNEDLMLSIAREGKGNYHFIKDGADTQQVFAKELDELTHIVAKAVKLRIHLADGVGFVRALGATTLNAAQTRQVKADEKKIDKRVYEELGITADRQNARDESGIKMLIPDFYRGDSHVVMLELSVPPGQGKRKVADVFLKYKDLVTRVNRETQASVSIQYTANRDEMIASVHRNVKKNLLGFQTGEALTEAADLIGQGKVAEAVRKVDERMVVLGVAARQWGDKDLDRDGKLLDRYKTVLADLQQHPQLARDDLGQYLTRSLTYNGYTMTR